MAQLLVCGHRLLSLPDAQPPSSEPQKVSGDPTRSHSTAIETEVFDLANSSDLQFPAIPLWPGIPFSLIMQ